LRKPRAGATLGGMDALAALRLQVEWGVDEALDDRPQDRRTIGAPLRQALEPASRPTALPRPPQVASAHEVAGAAASLAALRDALAGFDGCSLRRTATNLVFAEGDPESRLVLVADVPGPDEDRAGRPFAGATGATLDRMLASIGLDRAQAVLTSLVPWRPPGDRPPNEAELQACLPFLYRQLTLIRPAFAVLFGRTALRALAGGDARRSRGKWLELAIPGLGTPLRALAMPTVAHIRATPAARRDAWADLVQLRRALDRLSTLQEANCGH